MPISGEVLPDYCGAGALHPLEYIGIDTCSAMAVSTELLDFLWIDNTKEAIKSVELNGVGGGSSLVGGRGPMVVKAVDTDGNEVVLIDPAGVYLVSSDVQARLRIFGQQRLKSFGFYLQQNKFGDMEDYLVYKDSRMFRMETVRGILLLKTTPVNSEERCSNKLDKFVNGLLENKHENYCYSFAPDKEAENLSVSTLIINEAKLSRLERSRLDHWRMAHRTSTGARFTEQCQCCEMAKHKSSYKRNGLYNGTSISTNKPYWRIYVDGYGGQNSMGDPSYQGAIGGYVFACPVSGRIKVKLYASTEQYPAMLFQILQEIETEGFVCREVYCDTHAVNLSAAAEEVASMFKVKIIPISGGTPQELAYAESAVRTVGQMSRALMLA